MPVASEIAFKPRPKGDPFIAARMRSTFEITPTGADAALIVLRIETLASRSAIRTPILDIEFQQVKRTIRGSHDVRSNVPSIETSCNILKFSLTLFLERCYTSVPMMFASRCPWGRRKVRE